MSFLDSQLSLGLFSSSGKPSQSRNLPDMNQAIFNQIFEQNIFERQTKNHPPESPDNTASSVESRSDTGQNASSKGTVTQEVGAERSSEKSMDLVASSESGSGSNPEVVVDNTAESGNFVPGEGNAFPADAEASGQSSQVSFKEEFERFLEEQGIELDELKALLQKEADITPEQFDQLLANPEQFLSQLQQWLQSGSALSDKLTSLGLGEQAVGQLVAYMQGKGQGMQGREQETTARFSEILKAEKRDKGSADDLVSRLLKEQGGKDQDAGFNRDKLMEQFMAQKQNTAGKASGFSGLLFNESGLSQVRNLSSVSGTPLTGSGAESLHQVAAQRLSPAVSQPLPQLPVLKGLPGQPGATEALNERIMMMRSKGIQTAEIRLDPPDLGSLEVRVRVSGDTTSIQFHSPNAGVREALEAQVNRLREMMESAGVDLGQVDVSDQSLSEHSDSQFAAQSNDGGSDHSADGHVDADNEEALTMSVSSGAHAIGMVDYFA